jgi:hypothetical protein
MSHKNRILFHNRGNWNEEAVQEIHYQKGKTIIEKEVPALRPSTSETTHRSAINGFLKENDLGQHVRNELLANNRASCR